LVRNFFESSFAVSGALLLDQLLMRTFTRSPLFTPIHINPAASSRAGGWERFIITFLLKGYAFAKSSS
jgi:hypothetical protein